MPTKSEALKQLRETAQALDAEMDQIIAAQAKQPKRGCGLTGKDFDAECKRLGQNQALVMAGYRKRRAVRNQKEAETLHMFFSPTRVPVGMTNKEVRTCLGLAKLRNVQKELVGGPMAQLIRPSTLPVELFPLEAGKKMTRKRFSEGVRKFIVSLTEEFIKLRQEVAEHAKNADTSFGIVIEKLTVISNKI